MIRIYSKSKFISLPKAVICDLDNTLYAYDTPNQEALKSVQDKCINYFSIKATDFEKAFNFSRLQIKKELGKTASSHSRLLYFQRTFEYYEEICFPCDFLRWLNDLIIRS